MVNTLQEIKDLHLKPQDHLKMMSSLVFLRHLLMFQLINSEKAYLIKESSLIFQSLIILLITLAWRPLTKDPGAKLNKKYFT